MTTIIRTLHDAGHPFFMESRAAAQDDRLSYEARGVIGYLLSKPDDWRIEPEDLVCAGCGRDKVYRILKELVNSGYLKREKERGKSGRWEWLPYHFNEQPCRPQPALPDTEKPYTENPDTVSPDTVRPDTEKPEIKDSLSLESFSSKKTDSQDTESTGEGADAPTPPVKPQRRSRQERAKCNPYVQAFVNAFPDGYQPPVTANMLDLAGPLEKAGYTPEQLAGLVKSKLSGPNPHYEYKMRYALEDMPGHLMRQASVKPTSPAKPSRYDRPPTPELYRKPTPEPEVNR